MKIFSVLLCTAGGALVLSLLTGCGGSSSSGTSAPMLTPRSVSTTLSNGLTGTLTEDQTTVSVGGTVKYTLTLSNPTAAPITYQPVIGAQGDLTIGSPAGPDIYPGAYAGFISTGPSVTLEPGQSVVFETDAINSSDSNGNGYSLTGQYTARAYFTLSEGGTATSSSTVISATAGPLPVTVQ